MSLRTATKQTRFESSEKGSINQGFHERFYRNIFSWFIYPLPFETSGTASRVSIWYNIVPHEAAPEVSKGNVHITITQTNICL